VSVCQLVPDRSKADEDQRAENRESRQCAEGADRRGRDGPHNPPPIRDQLHHCILRETHGQVVCECLRPILAGTFNFRRLVMPISTMAIYQ